MGAYVKVIQSILIEPFVWSFSPLLANFYLKICLKTLFLFRKGINQLPKYIFDNINTSMINFDFKMAVRTVLNV